MKLRKIYILARNTQDLQAFSLRSLSTQCAEQMLHLYSLANYFSYEELICVAASQTDVII